MAERRDSYVDLKEDKKMAAMFLAKRGTVNMNIHISTSLHVNYKSNAPSVADGVITITSHRYFSYSVSFILLSSEFFEIKQV